MDTDLSTIVFVIAIIAAMCFVISLVVSIGSACTVARREQYQQQGQIHRPNATPAPPATTHPQMQTFALHAPSAQKRPGGTQGRSIRGQAQKGNVDWVTGKSKEFYR